MSLTGRRRSDRVCAQIPIRVSGIDAAGASFDEETLTVSINEHGACICLTHSLVPEKVVRIRNLRNGREEEFRVVGMVREVFGGRGEWGVEAVNPKSEIWGLDFVPPPEGIHPKALVQCQTCKKVLFSRLSAVEYEMILWTGLMSRYCDECGDTTRWQPSEEPPTEVIVVGEAKPTSSGEERRKMRRRNLVMCVRVRDMRGAIEIVQTIDASNSGLCVLGKGLYQIGEEVHVTLPFAARQLPVERKGTIVWRREGSNGRLYGIKYVK